jgi:hypothetical protein
MEPVTLTLEKKGRGALMRVTWTDHAFSVSTGLLTYSLGGQEKGRISLRDAEWKALAPEGSSLLSGGGKKSHLVQITDHQTSLVHVVNAKDEAARQTLITALQQARDALGEATKQSGVSLADMGTALDQVAGDQELQAIASGLLDLASTSDETTANVWEAGQAFLQTAGSVVNAVAPGLLDVARDVPFLGPIAGLLLKAHSAYSTMQSNKDLLSGSVKDLLEHATHMIVLVSKDISLLENDDNVVSSMKTLALAAHNTSLVANKLGKILIQKRK